MTSLVKLTSEYITLAQLLKEQNLISSGGQAKHFLADSSHQITVNGDAENRRGRKLYALDKVIITTGQGDSISVEIVGQDAD